MRRFPTICQPSRELWIAVIHRAYLDIAEPKSIGQVADHHIGGSTHSQTDAIAWVTSDSRAVGSLRWIVDAAMLPEGIMSEMVRLARLATR